MNIFAQAAVKPQAKTTTKKDKALIEAPQLGNNIQELQDLLTRQANTEARIKMLQGVVKEAATTIYLDEYQKGKKRPETLKIADETGAACSFIVMDRYTKVEDDKAEILKAIDPELLETHTTYSFNPEMLDKYGQQISDAITAMDIPDEDKANLITAEIKTNVRKGAIERLYQYPDQFRDIYAIINPVVQIKAK